jgi:transposase
VNTVAVTRRHDLTDVQWAAVEPLLPKPKRSGRPSSFGKRQLIDGIRWRVRVGAPWRDVPPCYGSWPAVAGLFRRWQRAGVWAQILTALQAIADADGRITWDVSVDSTVARAHQHAAGARKRGICRLNRPVGSATSPATTRWAAPVAA